MVITVTFQSSENYISEGTKNVNPLLDRRPGEDKEVNPQVTMEDWHLWRGIVRERLSWKYTSELILAWKWRTSERCWPSKESSDQYCCSAPLPGNSLWRPWPCGTPPGGHHGYCTGAVNSKPASLKGKLNDPTPALLGFIQWWRKTWVRQKEIPWMHFKRGALVKVWNYPERISLDHLQGCASSPMPTVLPLCAVSLSHQWLKCESNLETNSS